MNIEDALFLSEAPGMGFEEAVPIAAVSNRGV